MIKILPDETINKIAAGEVIERPASVLKELLENSLDAGAAKISVDVSEGGQKLIQVIDNGFGMSKKDAVLAFDRHATSKIVSFNDISDLKTLGFRGEALASIAAVSRVKLFTRMKGALSGTYVLVENGKIIESKEVGTTEGTRIEVTKLFSGVPVRRKFLKSPSTEMFHIGQFTTSLALTYPKMHFTFNQKNKNQFIWPAQDTLQKRIYQIFGQEVTKEILPVSLSVNFVSISGYVSEPSLNYSNRNQEYFLVNGRVIKNRALDHAVQRAYHTLLPSKRFPFFVLSIRIKNDLIDVNTHPTKKEIRFHKENDIHDILENTIKKSLLSRRHFPEIASPGIGKGYYYPDPAKSKHMIAETKITPGPQKNNSMASLLEAEEERQLSLKVIGQIKNTYLLIENEEGLLIVDQHALEERILYENLRKSIMEGSIEKQPMLFPLTFDISPQEIFHLEKIIPELNKTGFDIEFIGKTSLAVREIPSILKRLNINSFIHDALTELPWDEGTKEKKEQLFDRLIKMLACRSAIKAGDPLNEAEIKNLVYSLAKDNFLTCPHGRPIFIKLSSNELEKKFKRK